MHADPHAPDRTAATLEAIKRFDAAFSRHDVYAIMAAMTDNCVFESTYPPPDGRRFEGQEAVRGAWEDLFRSSPDASFETEELFAVDFFFSSRRRHTRLQGDWSSDVCSSD